jgi:MerR family transcriptional regulator, copper efflux regulator
LKVKRMRIGELARRAGVSTSRIRFYEACGVIRPAARAANGYRDYDVRTIETIAFIDRAQRLGFSLKEVAAHFRLPHDIRKAQLEARLKARLAELEQHIEAALGQRQTLVEVIAEVEALRAAEMAPS